MDAPLPYVVPAAPVPDADDPEAYADRPPALGAVLEQDRGSLPFALLHGESLVACAGWALGEAGVTALDITTGWESVRAGGEPLVLHDVLCPATPGWFLAACLDEALEHDAVVVGVRPVTDTVKDVTKDAVPDMGPGDGDPGDADLLGRTRDRDALVLVTSPVVLPAGVVATLDGLPATDLAAIVGALRADHPVRLLEAPPEGRRVGDEEDLALLEALTAPGARGPGD